MCTTLPSGHLLRAPSFSLEMTTSPTARFLFGWTHFFLTCSVWRYSLRHLSQHSLAQCCTLLQRPRQYMSALWNSPGGGSTRLGFIVRRWFGVNGSGASALHRWSTLRGLELIMHSTSVMNVRKVSSSSWHPALDSRGSKAFRTLRINRS